MTTVWSSIVVVAVLSFALKATGPALLGERELPVRTHAVISVLAPALLAGLVVTNLLGARWTAFDLTVLAGVAAATVGWLLRAPVLLAALLAVAVTAGLRLLLLTL